MPISQPPRSVEPEIAFGTNLLNGEGVSLNRNFFKDAHVHVRGSTGAGKSSQAILPLVLNLINLPTATGQSRPDPIFILDLGGDQANFHIIRKVALSKGRRFRFLSLNQNHDTDFFDPLQSINPTRQVIVELVSMLITALNLDYGMFYGGDYYTSQNTRALKDAAEHLAIPSRTTPITLDELSEQLDSNKVRDADQIRTTFMFLKDYDQLKAASAPSVDRLIDIDRAIEEGEVVYFFLSTLSQAVSVRPVAGLALYTIQQIALERIHQGRSLRKSWLFIDEFHEIAGRSFETFLAQCRKAGVSLFLANQHNSQLRNRDLDLGPLVANSTQLKLYFSAQSEEEIRELQAMSKTTRITLKSETVGTSSGFSSGSNSGITYDNMGQRISSGKNYGSFNTSMQSTTETEHIVPELEINDILDVDAQSGCFFFKAKTGDQHRQPIPVRGTHVVSKEVYEEARIRPLPQRPRGDAPSVRPEDSRTKPLQPGASRPVTSRRVERQKRLAEIWSEIESRFDSDGP